MAAGITGIKEGRVFFFVNKKKQKNFDSGGVWQGRSHGVGIKVFLAPPFCSQKGGFFLDA
jgi:hypothetical protein